MQDEKRLVIGVAGRIGSGKSVVAHYLAEKCGFQYLRYSFVLAEWFDTDPAAKGRLQEVGWDVMSGNQRELNRRLIGQIDPNRDCAVDGLRHPIDYQSLKDAFASRFFLIYIETPPEIRYERLRKRYGSWEAFTAADSHPVESHICQLRPLAAAVLSGGAPVELLRAKVERVVQAFRSEEDL